MDQVINLCCSNSSNPVIKTLASKLTGRKEEDNDVADTPVKPTRAPKPKSSFSNHEMKYENVVWTKLPVKVRRAAGTLGYDADTWDNSKWTDASDKHFHDLTPEEVKAAATLGWEENAWENRYEKLDFKDCPPAVQKAAKSAGFTEELWNDDDWPDQLDEHWDKLSEKDRDAMCVLGYTKATWD
jgi:hypothetical protein